MDIHDYRLDGYSVNCRTATIQMRFSRQYGDTKKAREIVFDEVAGYHFRDAIGSVMFDIEVKDMAELLKDHKFEFAEGHRRIGYPEFWRGDLRETMTGLKGLSPWTIGSSLGFEGWIVARTASEADQGAVGNEGHHGAD